MNEWTYYKDNPEDKYNMMKKIINGGKSSLWSKTQLESELDFDLDNFSESISTILAVLAEENPDFNIFETQIMNFILFFRENYDFFQNNEKDMDFSHITHYFVSSEILDCFLFYVENFDGKNGVVYDLILQLIGISTYSIDAFIDVFNQKNFLVAIMNNYIHHSITVKNRIRNEISVISNLLIGFNNVENGFSDLLLYIPDFFDTMMNDDIPLLKVISLLEKIVRYGEGINEIYSKFINYIEIINDKMQEYVNNDVSYHLSINESDSSEIYSQRMEVFNEIYLSESKMITIMLSREKDLINIIHITGIVHSIVEHADEDNFSSVYSMLKMIYLNTPIDDYNRESYIYDIDFQMLQRNFETSLDSQKSIVATEFITAAFPQIGKQFNEFYEPSALMELITEILEDSVLDQKIAILNFLSSYIGYNKTMNKNPGYYEYIQEYFVTKFDFDLICDLLYSENQSLIKNSIKCLYDIADKTEINLQKKFRKQFANEEKFIECLTEIKDNPNTFEDLRMEILRFFHYILMIG